MGFFHKWIFFYICVCCTYVWSMHIRQCVCWGQKTACREMGLFFHHVGSRDWTSVMRLDGELLYLLRHLTYPNNNFFYSFLGAEVGSMQWDQLASGVVKALPWSFRTQPEEITSTVPTLTWPGHRTGDQVTFGAALLRQWMHLAKPWGGEMQ